MFQGPRPISEQSIFIRAQVSYGNRAWRNLNASHPVISWLRFKTIILCKEHWFTYLEKEVEFSRRMLQRHTHCELSDHA